MNSCQLNGSSAEVDDGCCCCTRCCCCAELEAGGVLGTVGRCACPVGVPEGSPSPLLLACTLHEVRREPVALEGRLLGASTSGETDLTSATPPELDARCCAQLQPLNPRCIAAKHNWPRLLRWAARDRAPHWGQPIKGTNKLNLATVSVSCGPGCYLPCLKQHVERPDKRYIMLCPHIALGNSRPISPCRADAGAARQAAVAIACFLRHSTRVRADAPPARPTSRLHC